MLAKALLLGRFSLPPRLGGLGGTRLTAGTPGAGPAPSQDGAGGSHMCVSPQRGAFQPGQPLWVTEMGWKRWLCHRSPADGTLWGWV